MDETTQQNAALVEQAAASSREILDRMKALDALISRYKVSDRDAQTALPQASMAAIRSRAA